MNKGTARKKKVDFSIVRPSKITIFEYGSLTILLFCFAFVLVFCLFSFPFSDSSLKKWHNRIIEKGMDNEASMLFFVSSPHCERIEMKI